MYRIFKTLILEVSIEKEGVGDYLLTSVVADTSASSYQLK